MAEDAKSLIERAARRFVEEVPALAPMTLVVSVELQGRGDVQFFRLQMPEVQVPRARPPTRASPFRCVASSST